MKGMRMEDALVAALNDERDRLLRWMTKLTGSPHAADDIVQEAYIEAWRSRDRLTDASGIDRWLNAVAYNVYKRWVRAQGKADTHETGWDHVASVASEKPADIHLERDDLAELLDRATALLAPDTRAMLLKHYLEEHPQARIAQELGLSESAVAVRLHRGKLALRRTIEEAQGTRDTGWQDTRIWCWNCGKVRYQGKLNPETGELVLICPNCSPKPDIPAWSNTTAPERQLLQGMTSIKSALNRLMQWTDAHFRPNLGQDEIACMNCGRRTNLYRHMPDFIHSDQPGVHTQCQPCQTTNYIALSGIAASTQQGRRFLKDHPRQWSYRRRWLSMKGVRHSSCAQKA